MTVPTATLATDSPPVPRRSILPQLSERGKETSTRRFFLRPAVDAVRKLKASDGGDINVVGSGDLAQTLMQHGLGRTTSTG
ncbi:hypothetical protein GCM10011428_40710 [Streptomyces violaceus]